MKFKTLLINMKKSRDRLLFMTDQLNKLEIDFEIQEGVDGQHYDFSSEFDQELSKKVNNGRIMTKGEIGCALSHRLAIKKIIDQNLDFGLIMEDDVELAGNFKEILNKELDKRISGKSKWEYLSFNYPSVGIKAMRLWWFLFANMAQANQKKSGFWFKLPLYLIKFLVFSLISLFEGSREFVLKMLKNGYSGRFYRPLYLAGCYLVTKEGAEKLLELNEKLIYAADRLPNVARVKKGLKFYAYVPLIAKQRRDILKSSMYDYSQGKEYIYSKYD